MAGDQRLRTGDHRIDLVGGGTGERGAVGQRLLQRRAVERQPLIGGETIEQVGLATLLAHRQRHGHRVLLDGLVRDLAADPGTHRGHEDLGGGQERQVTLQLLVDDGRVGAELVEDRQERLEHAVQREERIRQRDPAHHGTEDIALVPLRAGQLRGHGAVAAQHDLQAINPLAGPGVHLVRHCRRADLPRLETLRDQLVAGHQADGLRERRRARAELHQRGDDLVVQRARVHLPHRVKGAGEAEVGGDALLELGHAGGVAVEQVEHVLRGAHGALDAAQRVALEQRLHALQRHQQFVGGGGETLAQRRGLRGDIVAPAGHDRVALGGGVLGQAAHRGDGTVAHQLERAHHLELLDVLREIAARHALVDVLVAGEGVELLDAGLHVVAGDALAVGDRVQVDLLEHRLVRLDHTVRYVDPQVSLRP